jgi:plasmid stabilization system protein ParE
LGDLVQIYKFIAADAPENAADFIGRIIAAIDSLTSLPGRHSVMKFNRQTGAPFRTIIVDPCIIYDRISDDRDVQVLTIRHGARRHPRQL